MSKQEKTFKEYCNLVEANNTRGLIKFLRANNQILQEIFLKQPLPKFVTQESLMMLIDKNIDAVLPLMRSNSNAFFNRLENGTSTDPYQKAKDRQNGQRYINELYLACNEAKENNSIGDKVVVKSTAIEYQTHVDNYRAHSLGLTAAQYNDSLLKVAQKSVVATTTTSSTENIAEHEHSPSLPRARH